MDAKHAKETFHRMLWRYHNKKDLFIKNWFDIYHLRVNPDLIYKHSPEAYAKIMEKE